MQGFLGGAVTCSLTLLAMAILLPGRTSGQSTAAGSMATAGDERAIRLIIANETKAWNAGDAVAYSRDFAQDGLFTNIRGQFFTGYQPFLKQHEFIFQGIFRHTKVQQDVVALSFPEPGLALIETLTAVSNLSQMPPGATPDSKGRLRTRLLQVIIKRRGEWKIVAYHNVDVKQGVATPEPGGD